MSLTTDDFTKQKGLITCSECSFSMRMRKWYIFIHIHI